jgi:hypothetical protein
MSRFSKRVALSLTSATFMLAFAGSAQAAKPDTKEPSAPAGKAAASDGQVPAPTIDTNEDGKPDAWDRDANGTPDAWDVNGDGKPDTMDNNGDGRPDEDKAAPAEKPMSEPRN